MGTAVPDGIAASSAAPEAAPGVVPRPAPASSNGSVPTTSLPLIPEWDAALTYDVLRPDDEDAPANKDAPSDELKPVFVGREELLGSLVNAISKPDRRGTYLISGYRGAGKTSLVIEAGRLSMPRLDKRGLHLFPLVLNVSEISASLQGAGGTTTPPLALDARRLLTALLRTLRNRLEKEKETIDPGGQIIARVNQAYERSQAAQFTRTAREQAEVRSVKETSRRRSLEVANLLRLLAAIAVLAAVALEGVFVGRFVVAVQAACVALAGVAVVSYQRSRKITDTENTQSTEESEYVFDNSLHQVETDLKDILDRLAESRKVRTMFVLEELDKVDDDEGEQLGAVIRYFKNLFTQAPALFFFLTDKKYFDAVDDHIAQARRDRTYAVEHTFFTNRVFVSRPSLDECLRYFFAVLTDEATRAAIAQIRDTVDVRLRVVEEMTLQERFLRVLLFRAQNHLFDLKNEMRGYVVVDEDGSRLVYDENTLTAQEQALAGLQFLIEQKGWVYRFRGGRDYANEILRNCLFAVCADIDTDHSQPIEEILPKPSELGVQLRSAERLQIADAVESLISDLSRGGAIDVDVPTQSATSEARSFRWRPKALTVFRPTPELEDHETRLQERLERAIRVCAQFEPGGPLAAIVPPAIDPGVLRAQFEESIEEIRRASRPLSAEDAAARSGLVVSQLGPVVTTAHTAHVTRLSERGWILSSVSSDGEVHLVSPAFGQASGQIVVAYGAESEQLAAARKALDGTMTGMAGAVVLVEDDPRQPVEARPATLATWRSAFEEPGGAPVLVTQVTLDEELHHADTQAQWGDRTSDELWLARLWTVQ